MIYSAKGGRYLAVQVRLPNGRLYRCRTPQSVPYGWSERNRWIFKKSPKLSFSNHLSSGKRPILQVQYPIAFVPPMYCTVPLVKIPYLGHIWIENLTNIVDANPDPASRFGSRKQKSPPQNVKQRKLFSLISWMFSLKMWQFKFFPTAIPIFCRQNVGIDPDMDL